MWIESVLGHSFLACNLFWPCSLIETSDTELRSRKVSYLKSWVSHWSGEKQRRWKIPLWQQFINWRSESVAAEMCPFGLVCWIPKVGSQRTFTALAFSARWITLSLPWAHGSRQVSRFTSSVLLDHMKYQIDCSVFQKTRLWTQLGIGRTVAV